MSRRVSGHAQKDEPHAASISILHREERTLSIEWNTYLAVGVERIDDQHKEIFRHVNEFMDAINQGTGPLQVIQVLEFLVNYTIIHFHDEEELMTESHFPDTDPHKEEHAKFCQDVLKLKDQITTKGVNKVNVLQTSHALVTWLVQHILGTDKALADHLRSHKH
jgi:hemerythrin